MHARIGLGVLFVLVLAWFVTAPQAIAPRPTTNLVSIPEATQSTGADTLQGASTKQPLLLTVVGDIMLDRSVWSKMQQFGIGYPFARISDFSAGSDVLIGNLEGPVTTRGSHAIANGPLLFSFDPKTAAALKDAGLLYVSLANNHTYNQGAAGLAETRTFLTEQGIMPFGDPRQAGDEFVQLIEKNGWRIALIGWNTIEVADAHQQQIVDSVKKYDALADIVLVLPHWGTEYQKQNQSQIDRAHGLIDAGADLIIGAHPHVVQGIEIYQDKPIIYSLGNFIFDQYWSESTQQGLSVKITLSEDSVTTTFLPVDLYKSQPKLATGMVAAQIFDRLLDASTIPNDQKENIRVHHQLILP